MIWYKQGVIGTLSREAQRGLGRLASFFVLDNQDVFITSVEEGTHSYGSLHYTHNAFDIRPNKKYSLAQIKSFVGEGFDVVDEGSHIHIEYDPK